MKTFFALLSAAVVLGGGSPSATAQISDPLNQQQAIRDQFRGQDLSNPNRALTDRLRTEPVRGQEGGLYAPPPADGPRIAATVNRRTTTQTTVAADPAKERERRQLDTKKKKLRQEDIEKKKEQQAEHFERPLNVFAQSDDDPAASPAPQPKPKTDEQLGAEFDARWEQTRDGKRLRRLERESSVRHTVVRTQSSGIPLLAPPPR